MTTILSKSHLTLIIFFITGFTLQSCSSSTTPSTTPTPSNYNQINLVTDTTAFSAPFTDTNLANAWGIAFGPTGLPWISANHTASSTIYDSTGKTVRAPVSIPISGAVTGGSPTGVVYNGTTDFGGNKFIFATEDGTIAGWKTGNFATLLVDRSSTGAVYKGIAIVTNTSGNFIYATDFHNNSVDVFNGSLNQSNHFTDPGAPSGFGPFGIQNINDTIYVTYARQKMGAHDDSSGAAMGYVTRFTPSGTLIGRFTQGGTLNSPWGIAASGSGFGNASNAILIGNFGDGTITAFDHSGNSLGQLRNSSGSTLSIAGLWAIAFNPVAGFDKTKLYFTAGPFDEVNGLFGYIKP